MTASLRPATEADQPAVGALHHRSRASAYADLVDPASFEARGPQMMSDYWVERYRWEQDTHRMTIAEENGALIGFSYVGPSETPGAAELYAIHLDPSRVGTGAGRLLMIQALTDLKSFGEKRAVLWVLEGNEVARRFYERGGWSPDGVSRADTVNDHPVTHLRYSHPL
ncbi:GNAT superfamily N-acetyltransferase [Actinoplanes lutulentus]|uniref:L-amino acid N-acyltransferase YncA n=1 Tax=Actinoplanes lutulentus TaxID=1287878 RepID=A0A327ZG49_9ACTN|nr:GNAT family N-acetyltransferase [Actinoplanes lutulentus]MBB2945563.1 GNAT superfamily N-acetyltransferase [Actinoplanes lutulentus]RAK40305.1 L-amino acid N-acyltransferase YncA [Actinoplanes lutulentus]